MRATGLSVSESTPLAVDSESGTEHDVGAVTVEVALGLCSVVAVLALALTGLSMMIGQLRCTDAAVEAARLVARGEQHRASEAVARTAPTGATLSVSVQGDQATTEVTSPVLGGLLPGRWLKSRAYAVLEPGLPEPPAGPEPPASLEPRATSPVGTSPQPTERWTR